MEVKPPAFAGVAYGMAIILTGDGISCSEPLRATCREKKGIIEVDIRLVENPDLKAEDVAALRKAVGWEARVERLRKILENTYFYAGCFHKGRLVGYLDVVSDKIDDAYIRNLAVHPDYQRLGIGSGLISMALRRIKHDGIKTVNILFEPHLAEFYLKCGFTIMAGGVIDNENK